MKVSYSPFDGRALGKFRQNDKSLTISSQDPFVLYHEMAHFCHNTFETLRPGILCRAEITAELSAAVLCQITGISGYQHSAYDYIRHYAKGKDDKTVLQTMLSVLSDVEKIVSMIWDAATDATEETEPTEAEAEPAERCSA